MEKRIFLLAASLLLVGSLSQAQSSNGLMVQTSPAGAEVVLEGEAIVSGVTPALFKQGLVGQYRVTVSRRGYEKYTTSVVLDPSRRFDLNIDLSPKTRFKAATRSLFLPGWGQRYSDQKTKGFFFQLATVGAGLAFLLADNSFNNKYDDYLAVRSEYNASTNSSERLRLWRELTVAQSNAYDAEETRRITLGIGIGVWALNVVDALLFFPDNRETFSVKGLTLAPDASRGRLGLTLSGKF